MRLFTGVAIPAHIADALAETVNRLRPHADLHWTARSGWHITIKFIGEWPEARLPELQTMLAKVKTRGPIGIEVARLGWFPNPHRPHTLFAGVHAEPALAALAEECKAVGKLEDRTFTPHITIAKIKGQSIVDLRQQIASMDLPSFGTFQATEFCLYQSVQSNYTVIATYPLSKELAPA